MVNTVRELKAVSPDERKAVVQNAFEAASTDRERQDVLIAAAEVVGDPADAVTSVLEAADSPEAREEAAKAAVKTAKTDEEKKDVAAAAVDALSSDQRKDLLEKLWPSESSHRLWVYVTGFLVAGAVAVGLGAIAWAAQSGENSVSASLVVLATGFASALLGGLLGAYIQR
jgi:hypothetical protein